MRPKIKDPARKLPLEEIKLFEKQLGIPSLPGDYVEFLMINNGGIPSPDTYIIQDHPEKHCDIQVFFGIDRQIKSSCLDWNFHEYQAYIPNSLFSIGNSSTNDLVCLSLSGETRGQVFFWDAMEEAEPQSFSNVYKIADSFTEFLENLFEFKLTEDPHNQ